MEQDFVRIPKEQYDKLMAEFTLLRSENKMMRSDIALFIKEGPGRIFEFIGSARPIVAMGKALKALMQDINTFQRSGMVGNYFMEKYKILLSTEEPAKLAEKQPETDKETKETPHLTVIK